ncbi:unnamed protein product [Prorocentrum cordatum]|uniref:Aminoglycoside phosphotransferase domain-containing protein n=1 Tax=Prorocentrum cordatum TaxID=2364126 RepID=A0ABN9W1L5_9DINO|nr:unnamed protein product [Polarella glacialis]
MIRQLVALPSLGQRGIIVSLEGGYNPSATADGLEACLRCMLCAGAAGVSHDVQQKRASVKRETAISLRAALQCQSRYWPCLTGWQSIVVAGVRLGDLLFPLVLQCAQHLPCWCGLGSEPDHSNDWEALPESFLAQSALTQLADVDADSTPEKLAERCVARFLGGGMPRTASDFSVVSRRLADTRGGLGTVLAVQVRCDQGAKREAIVKLLVTPQDPVDESDAKVRESFRAEMEFYTRGTAQRLAAAGAFCPNLLHTTCESSLSVLCLSLLPGSRQTQRLTRQQLLAALHWLARLHSLFWGERADEQVALGGLHAHGCFWDHGRTTTECGKDLAGWERRLTMAGRAIDMRLKADVFQAICHGDAKPDNMMFWAEGEGVAVAVCDFEHAGKAQHMKDVAYCMLSAGALGESAAEQDAYLQQYLELLLPLLPPGPEGAPTLTQIRTAYSLCICDFARWMCARGWSKEERAVFEEPCVAVLGAIDGGVALSSEGDYVAAVFAAFPPC